MDGKVTPGLGMKKEYGKSPRKGLINGLGKIENERSAPAKNTKGVKIIAVAVLCFLVLGVFAMLTYQSQQRNTIAIDGNFDDWQGVAKQSKDRMNGVPENIDIAEYASTESGRNVAFYAKVYGNMLYGDGRYIVEVPNENPVYVAEIREKAIPNANGRDVAYVFIDTDNNANTGFKPSEKFAVGADRAIEVLGKNGKIEASRVLEFAGTVPYEWNWVVRQSVDAATNGKQMETMASKSVLGIGEKYAVYFYMVDWQGKESKVENALKFENAKVSLFGLYLAEQAVVRTESISMEIKGTAHAPIYINGNSEFTSANGVTGGSGTQSDPYIIENWDIDGHGGTYCIWIENTDVWFVIRNCNLWNATDYNTEPSGTGIYLKNVTNGTLENNTCYDNLIYGIYLFASSNNTLSNNTCTRNCGGISLESGSDYNNITNNNGYENDHDGIYLSSSSYNNILNNNFSANNDESVCLDTSHNNCVANNTCTGCAYGIDLYAANNNQILYNNCSDNTYEIIYLEYAENNTISNNVCYGSGAGDIHLYYSKSTTLTNNLMNNTGIIIEGDELEYWNTHTIESTNLLRGAPIYYYANQDDGTVPTDAGQIIIANSTNILISGVTITNTYEGIAVVYSSHITITNSNSYNNSMYGISLKYSPNSNVTNNTCSGNGIDGLGISYSDNTTISDNRFTQNLQSGLNMWYSDNTTITNNNCSGNAYYGVSIAYSNNCSVRENQCLSNSNDGIYLFLSNWNTVTNNNCSDSQDSGISIDKSNENKITNNTCIKNYAGVYLEKSDHNLVENNTCTDGSYGIWLRGACNNTLSCNTCNVNWGGIYIIAGEVASRYNNITNNNCSQNSFLGIYLSSSANNNISYNICNNNTYGIRIVSSSTNNIIYNNNCTGNSEYGISLVGSCSNNVITYNTLYNNTKYGIYITNTYTTGNIIHHNNFYQNNGAGKGVNGNCQAYDDAGGNTWYDNTAKEGNYWSNWDGNGSGTANAYPIDGGKASDYYPLSAPTPELSPLAVIALAIALLGVAAIRRRK